LSQPILGRSTAGASIIIDVARLVETRLLLNANSGGGKSWALRRILEQTHGKLQHLVIDPEGEFHTGLGGWAEGFISEGYDAIGFDVEQRPYPGQLVLQDVLTLHGSQFRDAAALVASPPCQNYSYMAMPWKRAKQIAGAIREFNDFPKDYAGPYAILGLNALFDACFRIQREASEAAGRYIPMVVENVKGAQPWVGRARWHYGSFYLWGDVPALMPFAKHRKVPGMNFHEYEKTGKPGRSFQSAAVDAIKNTGGSWFNVAHNTESGHGQNPDGRKQKGSGRVWFDTGIASLPSSSPRRRDASAQIAKIPFPLAQHIAQCFKPQCEVITRWDHEAAGSGQLCR
jgi:hypothetical protein